MLNYEQIVPNYETTKQLPNILREALLGSGYGKTALLLDLLFLLGYVAGQKVTYAELVAIAGQYTSHHIIREGLLHFSIKRVKIKGNRRGRPTYAYILPSIAKLRSVMCDDLLSPTDVLHVSDMQNMSTYRCALHRELILRSCAASHLGFCSFSRHFLATRLNVSQNTIRSYEKKIKIHVQAVWERETIAGKQDLMKVPAKKAHGGKMLEAYRQRDDKWIKLPADRGIAGFYLKQGFIMTLYTRKTNKYWAIKPLSSNDIDNMPF